MIAGIYQREPPWNRGSESRAAFLRASVSSGGCKVAACLFAFLLGLLGARKFYLGQPLSGVFCLLVTLLLFWTIIVLAIFGVTRLVEGLVYLTYSDRDFARKCGRRS